MIEEIGTSSIEAWRRLGHLKNVLFLDSAKTHPVHGRWSFILADPLEVLRASGRRICWRNQDGLFEFHSEPWEVIDYFVSRSIGADQQAPASLLEGLEHGLVAGSLGYELGHSLEKLPQPRPQVLAHDDFWLGFFDVILAFDHAENKSWLVSSGRAPKQAASKQRAAFRRDQFLDELETDVRKLKAEPSGRADWRPLMSLEQYSSRMHRIRQWICEGDIYQANLTYPFLTRNAGDPAAAYERLRELNPAPFAAYLDAGDFQILSSSPEEFLKIEGREARTRPIKGTCGRAGDLPGDWERAQELLRSEKNRAELLMITDLLRNDLGRIAEFGTVCVPELVQCEEYATVYHLVSTVTGHLRRGVEPVEALAACFPGGSVTGAPKLRAQEILCECEPFARGIYTGSIGYFGRGMSHWNIAIRTLVCAEGCATFSVGGAITADSDVEEEHQETLDKAKALLLVFDDPGCYKKVGNAGVLQS